jgi:hypothetical protein
MDGANPFAKFAPTKPAYVPPPEKSENPFVQFTKSVDTSPFSKDELLEAYRQLPRDDPRREQVKQQIIKLGNVPFERGILSEALRRVGLKLELWPYYRSRDARTLWATVFPNAKASPKVHRADEDVATQCLDTIRALIAVTP